MSGGQKQPRILMVSYDFRPKVGGVATCADGLAKSLSKNAEVKLLAPRMAGAAEFDRAAPYPIKRVFLPRIAALSVPYLSLAIRIEAMRFKADCVFCMLWMPDGAATLTATRGIKNLPYFVLTHGVEVFESEATFRKRVRSRFSFLKNQVLKHAAQVFSVSNFTAKQVEICGVPKDRITVSYNGVEVERFASYQGEKSQFIQDSEKVNFVSVSRLVYNKGMDHAIEAIGMLPKEIQEKLHYSVVGNGPDKKRLERLIKEKELSDVVTLLGEVHDTDIPKIYASSDWLLFLSRSDFASPKIEGFGLVALEAAVLSVPAIAGNSGGVSDAVENEVSGYLVDPEDPFDIAKCIEKVVLDSSLKTKLGEQARSRAVNSFHWDHVAEKVVSKIKETVSS